MSWQTPDTYHTAGVERGTATSTSTRPATTSPNRAPPSTLVRAGGQTLLVDCGRGVLQRATAVGVGAHALTALLLTRLHSDHISDLGDLLITRWVTTFTPDPPPLPIIGPPGTAEVVDATLKAFGPDIGYHIAHHADLTSPRAVEVHEHTEGLVRDSHGVRITLVPTDHRPVAPTIGFRISYERESVVLADDTVPCATLDELAAGADALVHTVIRKDLVETMPQQRIRDICDYHSSVEQAAGTATTAGVGTLILTHCVPPVAPGTAERLAHESGVGVRRTHRAGARPAPHRGHGELANRSAAAATTSQSRELNGRPRPMSTTCCAPRSRQCRCRTSSLCCNVWPPSGMSNRW